MAKKKYTEQELYDLAADVHYASQIMHLIDSVDGKTEFDWERYRDRLEAAAELISPKYMKDYWEGVEMDFEEFMASDECKQIEEQTKNDPRAQEFIADLGRIKRGEMTEQELKDKIRAQQKERWGSI